MVFGRLRTNERGSIAVETAFLMLMLGLISLGVLDFGLAYSRNLELANAARAGMQYALVRKPVDNDFTAIVDAVNVAGPTLHGGENRAVTTTLYCECPDGTASACTGAGGEDLTCPDGNLRSAYLQIGIAEDYAMFFGYPGLSPVISLSESVTVRLN